MAGGVSRGAPKRGSAAAYARKRQNRRIEELEADLKKSETAVGVERCRASQRERKLRAQCEADLKLHGSMLAKQTDLAREAEAQGGALREVLRRYIEADDACRSRVYTCRQEDCDDGHCPIWGGEVPEHPCLYRDGLHALADGAGKPYLDVVQAARKATNDCPCGDEHELPTSDDSCPHAGIPCHLAAIYKAVAKLDNPADRDVEQPKEHNEQ